VRVRHPARGACSGRASTTTRFTLPSRWRDSGWLTVVAEYEWARIVAIGSTTASEGQSL